MKLLVVFPGPEPMWRDGPDICRRRLPDLDLAFAVGMEEAEARIGDAEAVLTFGLSSGAARKAARLKWIQAMGSGLDRLVGVPGLAPDVVITGLMFALSRHIPQLVRNQDQQVWAPSVSRLLQGAAVGIVGVGAIAELLALKCKGLGMTVAGITGSPRDLPGFDRMHPRSDLAAVAGEFDFLVLLAALTSETRGLVGKTVLEAMKPDALLINVGRGGLVDEPALIDALQRGVIGGAGLDVFAEEPLPPVSPLWGMPNVLVSPHNAGRREGYLEAVLDIFERNLALYRSGSPLPTLAS
jgi:D-2-hydroxyacid dehydrogenase (NADP+)